MSGVVPVHTGQICAREPQNKWSLPPVIAWPPMSLNTHRGYAVDGIANGYRPPRFGGGFEGIKIGWGGDIVVTLWS